MKIKRDDLVQVINGASKGTQTHKVIQVLDGGQKLIVEGVNRVLKHVRRGHPKSPQGGRLELDLPIDASNVLLYCSTCGKGTKTGYRYTEAGAKERFCRKCGSGQGQVAPAKARYSKQGTK